MVTSKVIPACADSSPWVVFLHGFGGSSDTWQKQTAAFQSRYNLLFINFHDKPGDMEPLSVQLLCDQIAVAMMSHHVYRAHVVSLSSGSLVALAFAALHPECVLTMVLGGGMLSFGFVTTLLLMAARLLKNVVPYMPLYKFFAFIIMPEKRHRTSRSIFVREAMKMGHTEFCRWVSFIPLLTRNEKYIRKINGLLRRIPFLYIMGSEDHLFKNPVIKDARKLQGATVEVIPECGHVCSIEKADAFNRISMDFLQQYDRRSFNPA